MKNWLLIIAPGEKAKGGISNYFNVLRKARISGIEFMSRGARKWPERGCMIAESGRLLADYISFFIRVLYHKYSIVQTNTSFGRASILRDSVYIFLAKLFRIKTIVFVRGWDDHYIGNLKVLDRLVIKKLLFRCNAIIVLSQSIAERIRKLGFSKKIFVETTIVDSRCGAGIDGRYVKMKAQVAKEKLRILFLSRVERDKGIYEALRAYVRVKEAMPFASMDIVGDGSELSGVVEIMKKEQIKNVRIHGFLCKEDVEKILRESHVLILPSYREGMPNSVLEAMAFGLIILSSQVGALDEIIEEGINGYTFSAPAPDRYAERIIEIVSNTKKSEEIMRNNIELAKQRFYSDKVIERLLGIYSHI